MTTQQLQLLHLLSQREERQCYVEWSFEGIDDKAIMDLQDKDLVFVSTGEGFVGSLRTLSLTAKGQDLIKDYCDTCECIPCDCDWGHQ
tara:strand:- start:383 stop:646 length:264 start_codon:yes stop_codon:yes gene_type:complete